MAAYTTIDDPSAYFKVQLYTGNGSANHAITFDDTDTDMQPDLVWIKNRDATDSHCLFDAVRGATEVWHSDSTANETDDDDTLDSFTSDGFQVDADVKVNTNTEDYVAWCWKANGSGSSNTDGSINTTATSANTTAGFSIIQFTGSGANATIGHGLGAAVKCFIVKKMDGAATYGAKMMHLGSATYGNTHAFKLDETAVPQDYDGYWNDTSPTATLISLGASDHVNSTNENICYAWAPIQGFSKFGTYVGNGNADGPFVYTGFRPCTVIVKKISGTGHWGIWSTAVGGIGGNGNDGNFRFDDTFTVGGEKIDFCSNGWKTRNSYSHYNESAATFIYMAFAEAPFVNSNGVPCNAR